MEKHLFFDENDQPVEFILKAKFQVDDTSYVAMVPSEDIDGHIYILRQDFDENGNGIFVGIDDDELNDAVEVYEELIKDKMQ